MAKAKCSQCDAVATVGGMCAFHFRESSVPKPPQPSVPKLSKTSRPVSTSVPKLADQQSSCAGPGCFGTIQRAHTGRPRRFCSDVCRKRAQRTK